MTPKATVQDQNVFIGIDFGTTKTMVASYDPTKKSAKPLTIGRGTFEKDVGLELADEQRVPVLGEATTAPRRIAVRTGSADRGVRLGVDGQHFLADRSHKRRFTTKAQRSTQRTTKDSHDPLLV